MQSCTMSCFHVSITLLELNVNDDDNDKLSKKSLK